MSTKDKNSKKQGEKEMEVEISERYINPYTDFGFKNHRPHLHEYRTSGRGHRRPQGRL